MKRQCDVCGETHGFEDWWSFSNLETRKIVVEGHRKCVDKFKEDYKNDPPKRGKQK
jgi:hypothetical protein